MSSPTVSVVISTLNRPQRLQQALDSVNKQTFADIEVIVVNDGGASVENITRTIQSRGRFPLSLISLPINQGLAHARNTGIAAARGALIALLDDDDRFRPEHVSQLVSALQDHPEATLAYDNVLILIEEGTADDANPQITGSCQFGRAYDKTLFEKNDYIVPSSMVFRRKDFDAIGGFDETMAICEDWDFLMRLRERGAFHYVQQAIGVEYSIRPVAMDNLGSTFDATRQAALDLIAARYGLAPLGPKTFLDVARELGFQIQPMS